MFATSIYFHPSLLFASRLEPARVENLMELHFNGKILALPTNIRHGCKGMELTNSLAYNDTAIITALKCFIDQASCYLQQKRLLISCRIFEHFATKTRIQ